MGAVLVIAADLVGGHWPAQARAACLAMTRNEVVQDEQTILKARLLRDFDISSANYRFEEGKPAKAHFRTTRPRGAGQSFAGSVGDAALAVALGHTTLTGRALTTHCEPIAHHASTPGD